MKLIFTAQADVDLEDIGDWIAEERPISALKMIQNLRRECAQLANFPEKHPPLERYRRAGLRRRAYSRYLIFYRIQAEAIVIIRILDSAQDYEAILDPDF